MGDPEHPFYIFGVATKDGELGLRLAELPGLAAAQERYERAVLKVRIGPYRYSLGELGRVLRGEIPRVVRQRAAALLGR
jgi:hypothetical protein